MPNTLQEITDAVSQLPESLQCEVLDFTRFLADKQKAKEVLDFVRFLADEQKAKEASSEAKLTQRKSLLLARLERFQIDMSDFRFDREDANARR